MRRFLALLALVVMVWTASAYASPAVTGKYGSPGSTLTIVDTAKGLGAGPTWAYFEDFEYDPVNGRGTPIDSTYAGNDTISYIFGDSVRTHSWQAQRFGDAGYKWTTDRLSAAMGTYSLWVDMRHGKSGSGDMSADAYFYPGRLGEKLQGTAIGNIFVSAFWKDELDTTAVDTFTTSSRTLMKVVSSAAAGNVYFPYCSTTNVADSNSTFDAMFNSTVDQFSLAAQTTRSGYSRSWKELANSWRRIDLWLKGETTAGGSDGRYYGYIDYAMVDSAANKDYGTTTTPWTGVQFNYAWTAADSLPTAKTYWDDIYIASGPQRVEIGDKITYGNCTKRYIQFPTYWSADGDSIVFTPNLGSLGDSTKAYIFIIGADGEYQNSGDTAIDSLVLTLPSISVSSDSTYFMPGGAYSLAFDNDSDDTAPTGYLATSNVTINWGDGQTTTGATSPATHTYAEEGKYRVTITGTNYYGDGSYYMNLWAYGLPDEKDPFPYAGLDLAKAEYDTKGASTYRARWWRIYPPTREVLFSLYDCVAGQGCRRVWPHSSAPGSAADTVRTIPRGTAVDIDLGDDRANAFNYRTPSTTQNDSTAVYIGWR